MTETLLLGLAGVVVLAVFAQWLAWRIQLPSILLLLVFGFIAGPVTGFLKPSEILGEALFPLVSVSVAIILFEGGLTLRLREVPSIASVSFRLITIGALITWLIGGLAAYYVLGLNLALAVLLGAVLIVTGPTVVGPLLRQVRPKGQVGNALKWEGILIDPVGAVLAVLVFEAILQGEFERATSVIIVGVLQTLLVGLIGGGLAAGLMILLLRQYWVPDFLQNAVALMFVVAFFTLSNMLVPESGLLTVTLFGAILANQKWVTVKHIVEFKESLQVLLIGILFIVLSSRLELASIADLVWREAAFVLLLILVARPLTVLASTIGTSFNWRERVFMSWMAPRGIVAASVASIFSFELVEAGYAGAEQLVPITFLVIVGTVTFYGLTAGPVARWLGLSEQDPQGVLIVGAAELPRAIGQAIHQQGFRVLLVDTNRENIKTAQLQGLETFYGNALLEETLEELDYTGIGRLMALTSNNEVNSLAVVHFQEVFDRAELYQLPPIKHGRDEAEIGVQHLRGRFLFNARMNCENFMETLEGGASIKATNITAKFTYADLQDHYDNAAIPLFLITERKRLQVFTVDTQPVPRAGQTLISLIPAEALDVQERRERTSPVPQQT